MIATQMQIKYVKELLIQDWELLHFHTIEQCKLILCRCCALISLTGSLAFISSG